MPIHRTVRTAVMHATHGLDIWLGLGRMAQQTRHYVYIYGFAGIFLPFILSADVFDLAQAVLRRADDDALLRKFVSTQIQQTSIVAMIGSVIAGNAVAALGKPVLSSVPWPAAAFFHASLVASLFCVYHAMRLNRIVGSLVTPDLIKRWLRSPPAKVRCADKNRPSVSAVLILDTPRVLVSMASVSFVVGWTIYVMFVYIDGLDQVAGDDASMNIMIFYAVSLWFAVAVYLKADIFDYYTDRDHTWLALRGMVGEIYDLLRGHRREFDHEEASFEMAPTTAVDPQAPITTHTVQQARAGPAARPVTPSERSGRKSLGSALLAEALRESIESRRKAIESDEQFIRALEMYQPDLRDAYDI